MALGTHDPFVTRIGYGVPPRQRVKRTHTALQTIYFSVVAANPPRIHALMRLRYTHPHERAQAGQQPACACTTQPNQRTAASHGDARCGGTEVDLRRGSPTELVGYSRGTKGAPGSISPPGIGHRVLFGVVTCTLRHRGWGSPHAFHPGFARQQAARHGRASNVACAPIRAACACAVIPTPYMRMGLGPAADVAGSWADVARSKCSFPAHAIVNVCGKARCGAARRGTARHSGRRPHALAAFCTLLPRRNAACHGV
jgi:hypothetical protein